MKRVVFIGLALLVLTSVSHAEIDTSIWDLKGLETVIVGMNDPKKVLKPDMAKKIFIDTKLKLKSAGLQLENDKDKCHKILLIELNKFNTFNEKALIKLMLIEEINLKYVRKQDKMAPCITYFDEVMTELDYEQKNVYKVVMDKLLIRFIDSYLSNN